MKNSEKRKMQEAFLKKAGPNATTLKAMMDTLSDVAFYMKDAEGRVMALNRRNCDLCNIHDEMDAIGLRSDELFPGPLAQSYISGDDTVKKTGRPIVKHQEVHAPDRSNASYVKSIFPLFDRKGTVIGTTCVYHKVPLIDGSPDWHGTLKPVTEFINAHYTENITLAKLASLAGTSTTNLRILFARTFGMPPSRYITTIRINAALKLLETTDKLVSEIAEKCGFYDQSHFEKMFKRERGITPGEYRRRPPRSAS